jgi:hypothetical protein
MTHESAAETKKPRTKLADRIKRNIANPPGLRMPTLKLGQKLTNQPCECGTSMLVPSLPMSHCPACHHSWRVKRNAPPRRCPDCQWNLQNWRLRMGVVVMEAGGAIPASSQQQESLIA